MGTLDYHQMNASYAIDYEMIFQHAPVGMCISVNRVIQSCNDALSSMFGYEHGALDGQSFQILYPTQDEFLRTGDRIIPIMNTKGRYSDERIMRRANGQFSVPPPFTYRDPIMMSYWLMPARMPGR